MRKIKLMTDYGCFPLWDASGVTCGNIDPGYLPISSVLRNRLFQWSIAYDQTLNEEDPLNSGFVDDFEKKKFLEEGEAIYEELKKELGSDYLVFYFP